MKKCKTHKNVKTSKSITNVKNVKNFLKKYIHKSKKLKILNNLQY